MKVLPVSFRKNGFLFDQIKRNDCAAIYSQTLNGKIIAYETIIIKVGPPHPYSNETEDQEHYPGASTFGILGWTFSNFNDTDNCLKKAENKFQQITNKIMNKLDLQDPKIIEDGVRLLKSQFIETYTKLGFNEDNVGESWHAIRTSPRGIALHKKNFSEQTATIINNEHMEQEVNDRLASVKDRLKSKLNKEKSVQELQQVDGSESSPEAEEAVLPLPKVSEVNNEPESDTVERHDVTEDITDDVDVISGTRGNKTKVCRELIAQGNTDVNYIAEQSGASIAYIRTILYNMRKKGEAPRPEKKGKDNRYITLLVHNTNEMKSILEQICSGGKSRIDSISEALQIYAQSNH